MAFGLEEPERDLRWLHRILDHRQPPPMLPGLIQYRKSVAEQGGMNTVHSWTHSGLLVGNSRKSPRDLDNLDLPAGCRAW